MTQLIGRIPDATPREEAIRRQVQTFRGSVGELLKQPKADESKVDETTVAKLFEEVKVLFRDLPQQVEQKLAEMQTESARRRRQKFHPAMFEELLHTRIGEGPRRTAWLMFVSLLRDDAPWLYELGHGGLSRDARWRRQTTERRGHDFLSVSRELRHGHPMLVEMMGPTDEDAYMALRHLPMIADEFLHRLKARNPKDDVEVVAGKNGGEVSEKK